MKRNPLKLLGLVLLLGIVGVLTQTLFKIGVFKNIKNYDKNLVVEEINTPPGIEDLDYDPETETVFLSSTDRRNPESSGGIFSLKDGKISSLTDHLNLTEFRPHGISFLNLNGEKSLFVISHKNSKSVVLKFRYANDSLYLENSFSSTDFSSPNDLVAVGNNAFFLTNDHGSVKKWQKVFTDFLRIPVGNVVYFNGSKSNVVLKNIAYPNGICLFENKIFVASTLGSYIGVYSPQAPNYFLNEENIISVPAPPDNLMSYENKIYFAAHPKLLAFLKHAKSKKNLSPSAVYSLENGESHLMFQDSGHKLSGSSTALPIPDSNSNMKLLVGSVFESKILKLSVK